MCVWDHVSLLIRDRFSCGLHTAKGREAYMAPSLFALEVFGQEERAKFRNAVNWLSSNADLRYECLKSSCRWINHGEGSSLLTGFYCFEVQAEVHMTECSSMEQEDLSVFRWIQGPHTFHWHLWFLSLIIVFYGTLFSQVSLHLHSKIRRDQGFSISYAIWDIEPCLSLRRIDMGW